MGSLQSAEQIGGHRGGASEVGAAWPRWAASVPHLLLPSSHPTGGEEAADVDVLWPDGSRPHVAGGVGEGQGLELTRPGATIEDPRVPQRKARTSPHQQAVQSSTLPSSYSMSFSLLLSCILT